MDEGVSRSRGSLSLCEHCEGNQEGGSFTGDTGVCVKEGSGDWHVSPQGLRW
jgi:hypothetical protein